MTARARAGRLASIVPLRFTLVAALVVMAALGLLVSGFAVTSAIEHSLISRTDRQLRDAANGWAKPRGDWPAQADRPGISRPPSQFYVKITDQRGRVHVLNDSPVTPDLPESPSFGIQTVGSTNNSDTDWRVLTAQSRDGIVTIAIKLSDVNSTVDRLVVVQLLIGIGVVLVLGIGAYLVVRRSLRPLAEVEATAAAIARGDLHKRVPVHGDRTEVGRLSLALNGMLTQIQDAFAATEASEEAARRSENKMRRFVADASHELRTPLTTIRGFAELYRQGAGVDINLIMNRIESESARMGGLVEDLLTLARLDSQRPLDKRPVDLLALAADAVHDARAVAPACSIKLEVQDGPGTPEVIGDDARLRQVLSNLVTNAINHTPADAAITVSVSTTDTDAVLQVRDAGPGLPPDAVDKVFERFFRTDTSRTRSSGGTGLGLSIVASLVAAHGGTVTAENAPEGGAIFTVSLPRVQQ